MKKIIPIALLITILYSCSNSTGNKFLGVWQDKKYDGKNNKSTITITKTENGDFLIDCSIWQKIDQYMHITDGSFKEVGHFKDNGIEINSNRLSLINDSTLLINGKEFLKFTEEKQRQIANQIETERREIEQAKEKNLAIAKNQIYKTVKIGNQEWMSENLNVKIFRNGDPILQVNNMNDWYNASQSQKPAWCYYEDNQGNEKMYGKLYNWYAVNDPRGLAPNGWHVPSNEEWKTLVNNLGGENAAGYKMKNNYGWSDYENNGSNNNGDNSSGFSALPGGFRWAAGASNNIGATADFWTCTPGNPGQAWFWVLNYDGKSWNSNRYLGYGCSVRCVKN